MKGWHVNKVVFMIALGCISEDVYDGCQSKFYVCVCAEVSLYVYSYEDVDLYDGYEVGFCVDKRRMNFYTFIELYSRMKYM